jgi:hypothetical protein
MVGSPCKVLRLAQLGFLYRNENYNNLICAPERKNVGSTSNCKPKSSSMPQSQQHYNFHLTNLTSYSDAVQVVMLTGVCQIWSEFFQRLEVAATRALNLPFGRFLSVLVGAMEYRSLGRTGVMVSPLCLGAMNFPSPTPEDESMAIIHRALDAGINFIDTANVYNRGESERS